MFALRLVSFLLLAMNLAFGFAPATTMQFGRPSTQQQQSSLTTRQMFETPKPLAEEGDKDAAAPLESASTTPEEEGGSTSEEGPTKAVYKNLGRGGNIEEVKWVDPAMEANVNPLLLDWWAYPLVVLPVLLLADDAFHFLPKEGPLAFLQNI